MTMQDTLCEGPMATHVVFLIKINKEGRSRETAPWNLSQQGIREKIDGLLADIITEWHRLTMVHLVGALPTCMSERRNSPLSTSFVWLYSVKKKGRANDWTVLLLIWL